MVWWIIGAVVLGAAVTGWAACVVAGRADDRELKDTLEMLEEMQKGHPPMPVETDAVRIALARSLTFREEQVARLKNLSKDLTFAVRRQNMAEIAKTAEDINQVLNETISVVSDGTGQNR